MPQDPFGILSAVAVALGVVCAPVVLVDVFRGHRQKMRVMEFVWPMTALYAGPLGLWAYYAMGRAPKDGEMRMDKPFWQTVAVSTSHCGAGCTLGDLLGEAIAFALAFSVVGAFALDFLIAYVAGLALQYVVIKPMKGSPPKEGLVAAFKADTVSIVAFQIGMAVWMVVSKNLTGKLEANDVRYWAMMMLAMILGFAFSYPANWWLVKQGLKEKM